MKPVAITMGDPAGIGPEIVAQAFAQAPQLVAGCFVAGDVACMRRGAAAVGGGGPPKPHS
jgi:4-hydroxythreonine-4-phosphate dehydrogenase